LLSSCFSSITSGICKSKVWEGKSKQRTYTYLELDELQHDFRYEETLEEEALFSVKRCGSTVMGECPYQI